MENRKLESLIQGILRDVDYRNNPYFTALREGGFRRDDFLETQVQFYHAVTFFSRPMAMCAAKIPTPELRVEILRNVWEEHGEGDLLRTHASTFLEFLNRFGGITREDIDRRMLWPEVRQFNSCLAGTCLNDDYRVGVAALGMIERMFCDISNRIGSGILASGWMRRDEMIHYNLHEKLDVKHSEDFFDVLKAAFDGSSGQADLIEQGLRLGAVSFNSLYAGLFAARSRRLFRGELYSPREFREPQAVAGL